MHTLGRSSTSSKRKIGDAPAKRRLVQLSRTYRVIIIGLASILSGTLTQDVGYEQTSGAVYSIWQTNLVPVFVPFFVLVFGLAIEIAISKLKK